MIKDSTKFEQFDTVISLEKKYRSPLYNMVILGGGCAGLQLLYHLSLQPFWRETSATLLSNEMLLQRSWCFWDTERHPMQHLVSKSWSNITFRSAEFTVTENILPYQYHYIKGEDFFNYFKHDFLPAQPNIEVEKTYVTTVNKNGKEGASFEVHSGKESWATDYLFSNVKPIAFEKARFKLWQHFKGWFIKSDVPVFDDSTVILMDFSIKQDGDIRFVYLLPFSAHEALIEMTVFSPEESYGEAVYDDVLKSYMNTHYPTSKYTIEKTEKGKIPMTDAPFSRYGEHGEILIGTAAGMVKATTGYAFKRIGRDSEQIARNFLSKTKLPTMATKGRFRYYDRLLLGILTEKPQLGAVIFSRLFSKSSIKSVFRFLDEETTLWEEIKIFATLPILPFVKQVIKQLFR